MTTENIITTIMVTLIVGSLGFMAYMDHYHPEVQRAQYEAQHAHDEAEGQADLKTTKGMEDCQYHLFGNMPVIRCPHSAVTILPVGKGQVPRTVDSP